MFGVRHQLDVGLADPIEDDVVTFTLHQDFGGLARGTTLTFAAAGSQHSRAFLPVEPAGAEVLATDAHGRPALLLRRTGRGSSILCTYPVEHMAALTPRVNPDDTVTLYDALATHAGARRLVTVDDPRVACDTLIRDDGALFAVLASHADRAAHRQAHAGRRRADHPGGQGCGRGRGTRPVRDQGHADHRKRSHRRHTDLMVLEARRHRGRPWHLSRIPREVVNLTYASDGEDAHHGP